MTTVTLTDIVTAEEAVTWCNDNMPNDTSWVINADFSSRTTYRFEFDDDRYATLFALTWMH